MDALGGMLAEQVQAAASLSDEAVTDLLPVPAPLLPLFPAGGLRRGQALAVAGSNSLLVAVLAAVSATGSWCAVVGLPTLGLVAAAEAGVALERLALVPDPGPDLAGVVGALVDGVDLVVVGNPAGLAPAQLRRVTARVRQRGAVLVGVGAWPGAELRLSLRDAVWSGAGAGDGYLRERRVTVLAEGRGNAARQRRVTVLLPTADGGIAVPLAPAPERRRFEPVGAGRPTPKVVAAVDPGELRRAAARGPDRPAAEARRHEAAPEFPAAGARCRPEEVLEAPAVPARCRPEEPQESAAVRARKLAAATGLVLASEVG
jgi:hypothetical protein